MCASHSLRLFSFYCSRRKCSPILTRSWHHKNHLLSHVITVVEGGSSERVCKANFHSMAAISTWRYIIVTVQTGCVTDLLVDEVSEHVLGDVRQLQHRTLGRPQSLDGHLRHSHYVVQSVQVQLPLHCSHQRRHS